LKNRDRKVLRRASLEHVANDEAHTFRGFISAHVSPDVERLMTDQHTPSRPLVCKPGSGGGNSASPDADSCTLRHSQIRVKELDKRIILRLGVLSCAIYCGSRAPGPNELYKAILAFIAHVHYSCTSCSGYSIYHLGGKQGVRGNLEQKEVPLLFSGPVKETAWEVQHARGGDNYSSW